MIEFFNWQRLSQSNQIFLLIQHQRMITFDRYLLTSIENIIVLFLFSSFLNIFVDSNKIVIYLTLFFEYLFQ